MLVRSKFQKLFVLFSHADEEVEKLQFVCFQLTNSKVIFKNAKNCTKFCARGKQTNYKNILKIPCLTSHLHSDSLKNIKNSLLCVHLKFEKKLYFSLFLNFFFVNCIFSSFSCDFTSLMSQIKTRLKYRVFIRF